MPSIAKSAANIDGQSQTRSRKKCKPKKKADDKSKGPCAPVQNQKGQSKPKPGARAQSLNENKGGNKDKGAPSPKRMGSRHSVPKSQNEKDKERKKRKSDTNSTKRHKQRREKIERASRRMSNLVFVMPKAGDDPQIRIQHDAEKKMYKFIRYLKKYWVTHIDKKFYPVRIDFKMVDRMTHQRPDNWWLLKRARQKLYEHTGFFSNVREPYHDLGPPELDSSMLIFQNLHEDLITDPTKWLHDRALKDELIRKCNAPLERLPRSRVRRPEYSKGRIKLNAGGMLNIEKYVKTGYNFLNHIQGDISYTQTLDQWMDQRQTEVEGLASAFGYVARKDPVATGADFDEQRSVTKLGKNKKVANNNDDGPGTALKALSGDGKKNSTMDDKVHHRNMVLFEKMMLAIYDIIRSLLNIKPSYLRSNYPLPHRVVTYIRAVSPSGIKEKVKPPISELQSCREATAENMSVVSSKVSTKIDTKPKNSHQNIAADADYEEETVEEEYENEELDKNQILNEIFSFSAIPGAEGGSDGKRPSQGRPSQSGGKTSGGNSRSRISPRLNTSDLVESIKMAYQIKESRKTISPEDLVKSIQEPPHKALSRLKAAQETYNKLFSNNKSDSSKGAVWTHINVDDLFVGETDLNLGDEDGTEKREGARHSNAASPGIKNVKDLLDDSTQRLNMPSTTKIPHVADIPTPTLAGLDSPPRLDSEEQSLQNMLRKNPEAAQKEPPSSPIQRLFDTAGIKTTEKATFNTLLALKKKFRYAEKNLSFYYANETEKLDWETMSRFIHKVDAVEPCPIFEKSISRMRASMKFLTSAEEAASSNNSTREKRPALWYRKLKERFDEIGASRHIGCASVLLKLFKYCDVDMKTKPKMLNRFCLLVISLPTTELGTRHWQHAVRFILDHLLGMPAELFEQWLDQRRLPSIM